MEGSQPCYNNKCSDKTTDDHVIAGTEGAILEPSWIGVLAFTCLFFMTALSDQGGIKRHAMKGLCSCFCDGDQTKEPQLFHIL